MYTLQILDRGQTFLHPLAETAVSIGSGETADLRLTEAGVLAEHARVEWRADSHELVAKGRLLVNGRAAQRATLVLGDRIEIGSAVLVYGRAVPRALAPDDVLAAAPRRLARRPQPASRKSAAVWLGAVVVLVAAAVLFVLPQLVGDGAKVQEELAALRHRLDSGDLTRAELDLQRLAAAWQQADDDRLQRLAAAESQLLAIRARQQELQAALLDPEVDRSYAEWQRELQRLEADGEAAERVAARLVRASLRESLAQRPASARPVVPANPLAANGVAEAGTAKEGPADAPSVPAAKAVSSTASLARAHQLAEQGLFAQALAVLQAELGQAEASATVASLQEAAAAVRAAAVTAAGELVAAVRQQPNARDALTQIASVRHRFPDGPDFALLQQLESELATQVAAAAERERLQQMPVAAQAKAAAESRQRDTIELLRQQLDRIAVAEATADHAAAAHLLREAAELVRARDADFAVRLLGRAEEAAQLAAWHAAVVAALAGGKRLTAAAANGDSLQLHGADGHVLLARNGDGELRCTWNDLAAEGLQALAAQLQPTGAAALGAAILLYRAEAAAAAEGVLAVAWRADAGLKPQIDRVLAHGRGEPLDVRGYSLGKDGFVAERSLEIQRYSQTLGKRLESVLRGKDAAPREALVAEVMQAGPDALAALQAALRRDLGQRLVRLDAGPVKKQVARLAAQRDELDRLRHHAKELIYDEVKYFYPYKPPAVSGEKHAEYNRVQAEVNRRVDAVRKAWSDDRARFRVPASLGEELARIDWMAKTLQVLGDFDPTLLAGIEWAQVLPVGETVGIAEFCRNGEEFEEWKEWRAIELYNQQLQKSLSAGVREQLRITNEYRVMFRHRPLAVAAAIMQAAQGHAEEMSRLGYFAHTSPTPGRESPFDRMRLAGYEHGISENIALHDGPQGAHNAWCHSSGHHRNLLNPKHREIGIGLDGRNWVQNFGRGSTYAQDPAFRTAQSGERGGKR